MVIRTKTGKLTTEYMAWANMISRCENTLRPDYQHYGGRGITVCREWRASFAAFFADMGAKPTAKHTLERIDNGIGYASGNCRWATRKEQSRNRRSTRMLTAFGKTLPVAEWAEAKHINFGTLKSRLKRGLSPEDALTRHLQTAGERLAFIKKCASIRWERTKRT